MKALLGFFAGFGFAVYVFAALPASSADSLPQDSAVRGVPWGATQEQVRAAEHSTFKHQAASGAVSYLVYSDTYLAEPVSVVYRFINDRLFEIIYNFESKGRKCPELSKKFSETVQDISAVFGQGEGDIQPSAACNAHVDWQQGDTVVFSNLSTDSGRSDLSLHYSSKQFSKLAEQTTVKKVPMSPPL
jgi:hypothetical protein